jgi:hypothetical protein
MKERVECHRWILEPVRDPCFNDKYDGDDVLDG